MSKSMRIIFILSLLGNLLIVYVAFKAIDYRRHVNIFLDKYINAVNELSADSVYREANKALQADTLVPGRVVFFGTQVMYKWDLKKYFPEYEAINRGVDGQRAAGLVLRFRPDVITLKPEAVVIEISSYNLRPANSVGQLVNYAATMAELAAYHGIRLYLTTMIPPTKAIGDRPEEAIPEDYVIMDSLRLFDELLGKYCTDNQLPLIDFNFALADDEGFMADSLASNAVEPNDNGYAKLAMAVRTILLSTLK